MMFPLLSSLGTRKSVLTRFACRTRRVQIVVVGDTRRKLWRSTRNRRLISYAYSTPNDFPLENSTGGGAITTTLCTHCRVNLHTGHGFGRLDAAQDRRVRTEGNTGLVVVSVSKGTRIAVKIKTIVRKTVSWTLPGLYTPVTVGQSAICCFHRFRQKVITKFFFLYICCY